MDGMGLETKAAFWSVIDANDGVEAVLWGHVHQNFDSYRDATRLIATPSTCSQFLPMTERFALDKKRPAYRHLELFDDGKIKSHVVRVSI